MNETIVSFEGVFKKYGTNEVLRDVSFSLRRGEWHASGELGHVSHRDTETTNEKSSGRERVIRKITRKAPYIRKATLTGR